VAIISKAMPAAAVLVIRANFMVLCFLVEGFDGRIMATAGNAAMSGRQRRVSVCFRAFPPRRRRHRARYTAPMNAPPSAHILVVDDDPALRDLLAEYLTLNGLTVETVGDGAAMRRALASNMPGAIVLDLMLPGEDGLSLARELRTHATYADVPILMLSARGEEIDRVVGLEVGADDYLAKPFSPRELLARLRALLRRARANADPAAANDDRPATQRRFGPFVLDLAAHRLLRDGAEVRLTSAEFELLRVFTERPNRVLSRDNLVDLLKGYERDPFDRSIDVRVTRLRRKIETDLAAPAYVRTIRGEGYLFNPLGETA
jgi:two-component system phosphate regulon response regulator OmpR